MGNLDAVRKIVLTGMFAALPVLLSLFPFAYFQVGMIKAFPFQHMTNIVAGIWIGPWYAALAATITALLRLTLGTGTIFAFPGGIPGAIVVGLAFRYLRRDWTGWLEPVGTGFIGVPLTVLLLGPLMGKEFAFAVFFPVFMVSSVPGTVIGYLLLKTLRRAKILNLQPLAKS